MDLYSEIYVGNEKLTRFGACHFPLSELICLLWHKDVRYL